MSKLNGRKIAVARLHSSTHVTGVGNVGPVIEKSKLPLFNKGVISLEYLDGGIFITGKGIRDSLLPAVTVQSLEFETEKDNKAANK